MVRRSASPTTPSRLRKIVPSRVKLEFGMTRAGAVCFTSRFPFIFSQKYCHKAESRNKSFVLMTHASSPAFRLEI